MPGFMPGSRAFLRRLQELGVDGRNPSTPRLRGLSALVRRSFSEGGRVRPSPFKGSALVKTIVMVLAVALIASSASAQTLPGGFVFLRDIDPTIIQDIRYAGSNNFVGRPLRGYEAAECVVKRRVALALKNIQQELAPQKLSLKMLDCYRPVRAVHDMVVWAHNGRQTPAERRAIPGFPQAHLVRLGYISQHSD